MTTEEFQLKFQIPAYNILPERRSERGQLGVIVQVTGTQHTQTEGNALQRPDTGHLDNRAKYRLDEL